MVSRNQVAASVAKQKEAHPEQFCPAKRCLWRTKDGSLCPRHAEAEFVKEFTPNKYGEYA